jgi:N-acetylmuramoyl-L-alanine amidase
MERLAKVTRIIVHHSQRRWDHPLFIRHRHVRRRGWEDIGYHYLIGNGRLFTRDGKLYKGRDDSFAGAHAFGHNKDTIAICLIGDFDKEMPTGKQMESLVGFLKEKMRLYGIGRESVLGHRELPKVVKTCPGKNLKMDDLRSRLEDP